MFRQSKAAKARSAAEDAWDALASAWDSARDRTGDLMEDTQERFGTATDEARRRATAALDALAGRQPSRPWGLLLGAVAAGAILGWVAAAAIGRTPGLSALDGVDAVDDEPAGIPTTS
jgi:ElaB/YqjD/DUF883 family membrane-anchored ribosome-binding protein